MTRSRQDRDSDARARQIEEALADYKKGHTKAKIRVRPHNPVSIRVRILDPDFRGKDLVDREKEVWRILERLPDEVQADVTMVLLLTPEEARDSLANYEFEHPTPSLL
jgi:stress-induced morphogen